MAEETADFSGAQKAAIFLLSLGEEGAANVMRHMQPKEVQAIGEAMANLGAVSDNHVQSVVSSFATEVEQVSPFGVGAEDFTRRVMVDALGETKARTVLGQVMQKGQSRGLESLKWMDARAVTALLKNEHPQITAMVLASLDAEHAAAVLKLYPEEKRADVVYRLATLDEVDDKAMHELDQILEKQINTVPQTPPTTIDGIGAVAGILNHLEPDYESNIMDSLKEIDDELQEKVSDMMFVFDDLMSVDDRSMQRLLREISVDNLVIALKGVDNSVKEKFFNNMSSRAAEMLKEDLDSKGPVKVTEVQAAQKEILTAASKLAEEGEITLGSKGGGGDTVA